MAGDAEFVWEGLDELRAALRKLPDELTADAHGIVSGHANNAAQQVENEYPVGPTRIVKGRVKRGGTLKRNVKIQDGGARRFGVNLIVKSTAPHAYLFEVGSAARSTRKGANRGSMPPKHVFVPHVRRERRAMYDDLKDLLRRAGLVPVGDER